MWKFPSGARPYKSLSGSGVSHDAFKPHDPLREASLWALPCRSHDPTVQSLSKASCEVEPAHCAGVSGGSWASASCSTRTRLCPAAPSGALAAPWRSPAARLAQLPCSSVQGPTPEAQSSTPRGGRRMARQPAGSHLARARASLSRPHAAVAWPTCQRRHPCWRRHACVSYCGEAN